MPVLSIPKALSAKEGSVLAVRVAKEGPGACSATLRTRAGTASYNLDYTGVGPVAVAFADRDASRTVAVQIRADAVRDPGETFEILLENPRGCTLGNAACTVTVAEAEPVVGLPARLAAEEGGTARITVSKSGAGPCSVSLRTRAGTASYNRDYTGVGPVTVAFAAAETSRTVEVRVMDDAAADPGETFEVLIEDPRGCRIGNAACTVTVADRPPAPPPPPRPTVSLPASVSVTEGDPARITLSKSGAGPCSVSLRTKSGTAEYNRDYEGIGPVTVEFGADESARTVEVRTLPDAAREPDETLSVLIEDPRGCDIANAACAVTVRDPEPQPQPQPVPPPEPQPEPEPEPMPTLPKGKYPPPRGFSTSSRFGIARKGGDYYRVTNLNDDGPGSLAEAFTLSNRLVIFEVGGTVRWKTDKRVTGSNLIIAGETAPHPGITVQGNQSARGGSLVVTSSSDSVRFSHITFERGYADPGGEKARYNTNADAISAGPPIGTVQSDWHFDHCAFLWGNDENVQLYHSPGSGSGDTGCHRWDFTNCMFSEPLAAPEKLGHLGHWENGRPERNHNYNMILGRYAREISVQHCLFSEHRMRGPFIDSNVSCVLANNIAINCGMGVSVEMNQAAGCQFAPNKVTCVGYLMISGPNAPTPHAGFRFVTYGSGTGSQYSDMPAGSAFYVHDLYAWKGAAPGAGLAPTSVTWDTAPKYSHRQVPQPKVLLPRDAPRPIDIPGAPAKAMTADAMYRRAIENVGPRPKEDNGRRANPAVRRAIEKLRAKTGRWVDHESPAGGGAGKMPFTETRRKLDGTTRFDDGARIPPPPPYADADAVEAWLREFRGRLQHDY